MKSSIVILSIVIEDKQLQRKFKHAGDFGIRGSYSLQNIKNFKTAIKNHLQSSSTQVRKGTFRRKSVFHYFDTQTGLNIILNDRGYFVSGWKLNEKQLKAIIDTGNMGGAS